MKSMRASATASAAAAAAALIALSIWRHNNKKVVVAVVKDNNSSTLRDPPTPSDAGVACHWLFGHAMALQPTPNSPRVSHDIIFFEWMKRLNSKVVLFQIPVLGKFIVVGDAEVARIVLSNNKSFPKSPTYKQLLPLLGRKSMVAAEGDEWASQRKLYNPGFSPEFLKNIVYVIVQKCNRFIKKCDEDLAAGLPTDMLERAIDLTVDVIVAVAFGEDWNVYDTSYANEGVQTRNTMRELTELLGITQRNPLKSRFDIVHMWKSWRLSLALDRDMQNLIQRRFAMFQYSVDKENLKKKKDILSLTLSSVLLSKETLQQTKGGVISISSHHMENMTSQLKTFYFAGHDTTATTIAWAYWLLLQNRDSLKRVRDEVVLSLGTEWVQAAMKGEELSTTTYEKLQKCEYLAAVVRETLRLYPPAASTRYAIDPSANAEGLRLGKSIVHLNFYAIQRDPDIWEKPDQFVPERFIGEDGKKRVASSGFLPFSKGSRDCIGKYFALLEAKIALAALICRYDGTVVDENEVYTTRLTSIPSGGCAVNLRLRDT
jgi:cytochrome P450